MQLTTRGRRRSDATAPEPSRRAPVSGRVDFGRAGEARHRNPGWLLAGILVVLVSAIGGVVLFASADERHGVLVAAGDIEVGQPIQRSHLRVVQMSSAAGVATLGTGDAAGLLGQIPIGRVPAGTVLNRSMFAASSLLGPGEMVFGAALDPGEAPVSAITTGASVRLLMAPRAIAGAARDAGAPEAAQVIGDGVVWDAEALGSGKVWLSVRTAVDVGLVASKAAQDDELRVVIIGDLPSVDATTAGSAGPGDSPAHPLDEPPASTASPDAETEG